MEWFGLYVYVLCGIHAMDTWKCMCVFKLSADVSGGSGGGGVSVGEAADDVSAIL